MKYDPNKHHRRSIRLKGWDYADDAAYFVTICVHGWFVGAVREPLLLLGDIVNGEMQINEYGEIVAEALQWLNDQYDYAYLDAWVIMPNHIHLILVLSKAHQTESKRKPLGRLIGAFKTVSTKKINQLRATEGQRFWQRNYYEHIIRNPVAWEKIRLYIAENPAKWEQDQLHPDAPPNKFNRR